MACTSSRTSSPAPPAVWDRGADVSDRIVSRDEHMRAVQQRLQAAKLAGAATAGGAAGQLPGDALLQSRQAREKDKAERRRHGSVV